MHNNNKHTEKDHGHMSISNKIKGKTISWNKPKYVKVLYKKNLKSLKNEIERDTSNLKERHSILMYLWN